MLCVRVWLTHRKMASNCLVFKRTKENTAVQQLLQFVSLRTFLKNEIERERSVCCHGDIPLNKRLARLQSFVMIRIFYRRIISSKTASTYTFWCMHSMHIYGRTMLLAFYTTSKTEKPAQFMS